MTLGSFSALSWSLKVTLLGTRCEGSLWLKSQNRITVPSMMAA
ncbi:hypothetical protein Y695_03647 [Hydrogenophaga sp. T4]|nr:hypothetical protein Y695_03647 [Hydrogenophaga sp. T4]